MGSTLFFANDVVGTAQSPSPTRRPVVGGLNKLSPYRVADYLEEGGEEWPKMLIS
jgi:hypothetical protein